MTDKELAIGLRAWLRDQMSDGVEHRIETLSSYLVNLYEKADRAASPRDEGDKGAALQYFDIELRAFFRWLCGEESPADTEGSQE